MGELSDRLGKHLLKSPDDFEEDEIGEAEGKLLYRFIRLNQYKGKAVPNPINDLYAAYLDSKILVPVKMSIYEKVKLEARFFKNLLWSALTNPLEERTYISVKTGEITWGSSRKIE